MKIKNIVIIVSVFLNLILGFMVVSEKKSDYDNPTNLGLDFKEAIRSEIYSLARTLFAQGRDEYISSEKLKKVNEIISSRTSFQTYELLTFDNGEMVLLDLTPNKKYAIQDVKIIPEALKSAFK